MTIRRSNDIVHIYGPDLRQPGLWRVQLRNGTITSIATASSSAQIVEQFVVEYREMLDRLADK